MYFHCSAGRNRTGTVTIGTLLELDMAIDLKNVGTKAKTIRPENEIKREMKETIKKNVS